MMDARALPGDDDTPLYDLYIANRASAALAVAVRIGLFPRLAQGSADAVALAAELGFAPRPTEALLIGLVSLGVLRRDSRGAFELSEGARSFLQPDREPYLGWLIDLDFEHFITPQKLLAAMKLDREQAYGDRDVWQSHQEDPDRAAHFARAMHSISIRPAKALARASEFSAYQRLLDVGGGQGTFSREILRNHPRLRATVFELASVCELVRKTGSEGERLDAMAGDMFRDCWPKDYDLILLSQVLHDWSPKDGARLLAKAHDALPSGGAVLIHEKLLDDQKQGPVATALVSLDMVFWTEGQQYSGAELREQLNEAGFSSITVRPTTGYWSLVVGHKR